MPNDTRTLIHAQVPAWEDLEVFTRGKVQQFIQQVLEQEVTEFLGRARSERRAAVDAAAGYRNGFGAPRRLAIQGGAITLRRPRLRGLEARFASKVLPLFRRRTKELGAMLPELYLHGLALGDFELALRGLLGEGAPLSPSSIARLKAGWQLEYEAWKTRDLSDRELVYVWADGVVREGRPRDGESLPARGHRGLPRRPQGAARAGFGVPRVNRVVAGGAARPQSPRPFRSRARRRRRRDGLLGRSRASKDAGTTPS